MPQRAVPTPLPLDERLVRIEARIRAIRQKVEARRPCIDILQDLAAAEAALGRIGPAVFRYHVDHCLPTAAPDAPEGRAPMTELVDIFDRFSH